jgi:multisubunit Na+/H+ antiporter MnhF subunit
MTVAVDASLAILALAGLGCLARVLRPGSIADRVVALDVLLLVAVSGVAVGSLRLGTAVFADLLVVVSLLGCVGTVTVARFMERRGP